MFYLIVTYDSIDKMKEAYEQLQKESRYFLDFAKESEGLLHGHNVYVVSGRNKEHALEKILDTDHLFVPVNCFVMDEKGRAWQMVYKAKLKSQKIFEQKIKPIYKMPKLFVSEATEKR